MRLWRTSGHDVLLVGGALISVTFPLPDDQGEDDCLRAPQAGDRSLTSRLGEVSR